MTDRLAYLVFKILSALAAILPLQVCCGLGAFAGWMAHWLAPGYRRLALRNLEIAFGQEMSAAERRRLARKHFTSLGANLVAGLKIAQLKPEGVKAIVTIEGEQYLRAAVDAKRGFVPVLSHLGNWELLSQISPLIFGCRTGAVYQRLGNPYLDAEVRRSRARLGIELFERKEGFQGAMAMLRDGGSPGVLLDQHAGDAGVWVPFFGRLASTSSLAATMALRTGSALLPMAVYSDGWGHWRMVIEPPIVPLSRDAAEVTGQINRVIESQIRKQPADWFWVHNRWKTPKPKFLLASYKRGVLPRLPNLPEDQQTPLKPFPIVIRASNWLGDAIMSAPAVRAIKAGRPDAHVTILTPAKLADFWRSMPEVDAVLCIEPGDNVFKVAAKLRNRFEVAVVFPNSLRTGLEVYLAGIPRRVGYPGHRRSALLNQVYVPKKKRKKDAAAPPPRHQVNHYLDLAAFIGAEVDGVQTVQHREPPRNSPPIIGLCPGAEYGPAKRWIPARYAHVVDALHASHGAQWKMFGVAKDQPIAAEITGIAKAPITDLIGKTSLAELIAQLRSCDLLVSNDTGTMHLAASLGVPVVAIFGSTEPALTGPLGDSHQVLRKHVDCSPCFLRECPLDFRCMEAVTVKDVVSAVTEILQIPAAKANKDQLPINS